GIGPTCARPSNRLIGCRRHNCILRPSSFRGIVFGTIEMIDRYEWLSRLASKIPDDALVMSTFIGAVGFEWADLTKEHPRNCMLGQMGYVIAMGLGLAMALPHRKVICLDADGSVLLELGQLVTLGQEAPKNLVVFVVDNQVYESIGTTEGSGPRPTATAMKT